MYRQWRHRLYKEHFLPHKTLDNPLAALQHRPADIQPEDWEYLCHYFASEDYTVCVIVKKINYDSFSS